VSEPSGPPSGLNPAYGRFSRWYGIRADPFERRARSVGLRLLDVQPGETVLEIGHGTGRALVPLAEDVGSAGRVVGLDLSPAMHRLAEARLRDGDLLERVDLDVADATRLPYADGRFDAAFACFTIEALPEPQTGQAVAECRRVIRRGGRAVVVAISDRDSGLVGRLYRWARARWPWLIDCRPVPVATLLADAGFEVTDTLRLGTWGIPVDAVRGRNPDAVATRGGPIRAPEGASPGPRAGRGGLRVVGDR
jgi:ubiquinone/menaquinone biosynthesis C-methylase UbiE